MQNEQLVQHKIQFKKYHIGHMQDFFKRNPYWERNVWDTLDEDFPLDVATYGGTRNRIRFDALKNSNVSFEIKYYLATRFLDETLSYSSVRSIHSIIGFINDKLLANRSIVELPYDKIMTLFRTYLISQGRTIECIKQRDDKSYKTHSLPITFLKGIYEFYYYDFYDDREETEKDIWDVRKLGVVYPETCSNYKLDFKFIPLVFRHLVKRYLKLRLVIQRNISFSRARGEYIHAFNKFFLFIQEKHPAWNDLKALSREDIVDFIDYLRNSTMVARVPISEIRLSYTLGQLTFFLEDIQRYEWDEAPFKYARFLIFPQDLPKQDNTDKADKIKYVPDKVWDQLVDAIENPTNNDVKLEPEYVPILLVMEASGFRSADVLALKADCLMPDNDEKWWLVGDQSKVSYRDHKVPISDEIAAIIMTQQELTKEKSTRQNNPNNYLFVKFTGKRKGKPISAKIFNSALNRFAKKANIRDEQGNQYHFRNHAFRHRYGVSLINNGMNILHVQKLMCHVSPEMTMRYARLLDNTLREEWKKARQGATVLSGVSLDANGNLLQTDLEYQADENGIELAWIRHNLDAIRLDHGLCIKSPKVNCNFLEQLVEPPCIANKCRSFHVDSTFSDYYKAQIEKLEVDIEIHKKHGRIRSIELNEKKLTKYKEIYNEITNIGGVFGTPKERREYVGEEREKVTNG